MDEPSNADDDSEARKYAGAIEACQRVLQAMTGIILVSFLLIIVLTTASTSGFVQFAGKTLYYLILASAVASLITWALRVRLQKKIGETVNVAAELLKRM